MYKLFLCLRFLRRRHLALVGAVAIALCVAMVLIVVSVMDGFLRMAEDAAKGLWGDIIVDNASVSGIGRYEEFIAGLTGRYRVDGQFELAQAAAEPAGQFRLTGRADATMAQLEALAGGLAVAKEITYPAQASLYSRQKYVADLHGSLSLQPGGKLLFTGQAELSAAEVPTDVSALRLGPVYAKVGEGIAEIDSATPVVYAFGLLRLEQGFCTGIQISGIRLPERVAVTDFEKGLFVQADSPHAGFDPPIEQVAETLVRHARQLGQIISREQARRPDRRDEDLLDRLNNAGRMLPVQAWRLVELSRQHAEELARPADKINRFRLERLAKDIQQQSRLAKEHYCEFADVLPARRRAILGLGIEPLSFRTSAGESVRVITPLTKVILTLLPLGRRGFGMAVDPNTRTFSVIDDCKTGVYTIDSKTVYVPFDELQQLADMDELRDEADPSQVDPARCSQIQIKVKSQFTSPAKLLKVRRKVQQAWKKLLEKHGEEFNRCRIFPEVKVRTWYERLEDFIGPIQKQRTLVALMFGIISLVSVLLIFAIFYMIVVQKTRDIGVVRAVGGSSAGVAQIFLAFGAATGLLGSALGVTLGVLFVRNINGIHDWLASWWGFRVFTPETFLFDRIPNQVDPVLAVVIAAWAILSGLVGALIPAVRAATMAPAEAVRYE